MISREMPCHNFKVYHTAPLETETFSPHCRAPLNAGATFPGRHHAFSCSLEQAVGGTVITSTRPAAVNSAISVTMPHGVVGQKQLPGDIVTSANAAVPSAAAYGQCIGMCSSSVTSSHSAQPLSTCTTPAMSLTYTSTAAHTDTCTKPVSSSSVLCHQQCVPQILDEKLLPCSEADFVTGWCSSVKDSKIVNKQLDRTDNVVIGGAIKVEPKVEVEAGSVEASQQPFSADISMDVKTEQLKQNIKSEVTSDESLDQHIQNEHVKLSDATVTEKPACDAGLKKESRRKGTY